MNKIILIYFVLITIHASKWIVEARSFLEPVSVTGCESGYVDFGVACGSDGVTYSTIFDMACAKVKM